MSHQMNRPSMLTRWPWKDWGGGEREPERQTARAASPLARRWAVGKRLALVAVLALGAWLALAIPSSAFPDSALDPQSRQVLAGVLSPMPRSEAPTQGTAAEGRQRVTLGPLNIQLGTKEGGSFTARARGGQVIFANPDNPSAISFRLTKTEYPSPRVISVTVITDAMPVKGRIVGTGIVYGFRGSSLDDSSYYAILLTGDGAVTIARRTLEGNLQDVARFSNPRIAPAGRPNVLTVIEQGDTFAVVVNGESFGSIGGGTVGPGGSVGIAFSGIGNHGFEGLEISTARPHAASPAPDDAPAQRRGRSPR
jgi:hypothetical protein